MSKRFGLWKKCKWQSRQTNIQRKQSHGMAQCDGHVCALPTQSGKGSTLSALPLVNDAMESAKNDLGTPIVLLYFSASWCPPCQHFSPLLSQFIQSHTEDVTCIYVSADRSKYDMQDYIQDKGWLNVSWEASSIRDGLFTQYGIYSIPTLLVLDRTGKVITTWGKSAILKNSKGCIDEWKQGRSGVGWLQLLRFW
jgi:nucleoredoxin